MTLTNFNFDLPGDLIGQKAIEPRDSCRLIVVNRYHPTFTHHIFRDLPDILDEKCVLVLNDTKVFPARLYGTKDTGGKIEVLLLKQLSLNSFTCILRGKTKDSQKLIFSDNLSATVLGGEIKFSLSGTELLSALDALGKTPLPPYIHSTESEEKLREQYQTVYAREKGSTAAPTAGLHFTESLLSKLAEKGVQVEKITLHVGLGTFKPVTEEQIASKTLHSESFWLSAETAQRLNQAKKADKKIIAVGTTTCRVLESQARETGKLTAGEGETNLFIQSGFHFNFVDGLITNFHLPGTSLLMLVSAFVSAPNSPITFKIFKDSLVGRAYAEAIKNKYKFFSFGDAMMII